MKHLSDTNKSTPMRALKHDTTNFWFVRGKGFTGKVHDRTFHTPEEIAVIRAMYDCKFTAFTSH